TRGRMGNRCADRTRVAGSSTAHRQREAVRCRGRLLRGDDGDLRARRVLRLIFAALAIVCAAVPAGAAELPIFDAHIHYSHDAWDLVPPKEAIEILRKSGVIRALVSSSNDEGTQKLLVEAPDLIVPELRPYRTRDDTPGWVRDEGIVAYLDDRLRQHRYVAIGEFHLYGADADLPVPRRVGQLPSQHA